MNKVHRTLSIHVYGHRSVIVLDRLRLKPFAVPWKSSILQKKNAFNEDQLFYAPTIIKKSINT